MTVVWVVPVRFLVSGPLRVVEVSLGSWLQIIFPGQRVRKRMLVQIDTLVDSVLNVVRLSSDWVAESFVGQNDIFEEFLC
jgi:hypothetical protein